ncbi:TVP38/TMEM64 family protein [Alicyclobacillus dauci]|uniref:TVP38/TMEM64 family membrane protein n=1 Tax=Alicyclobacillus dauci TaxID=1475485 RepID=A0ABY6Z846_9BACL|nr:VTT domain-containing protein [Alicyclobacillus dauci]WAH38905.1 VTT domain-containing protein [Alicyclobacillus dauci]
MAFAKQVLTDWRAISMVLFGVLMVGVLLFLDRHHKVSQLIRSWGFLGVIIAILLMLIWCLTPIPSEGLLIIFLRVFGVTWGTLYAWIGSTLSACVIFYVARHFTRMWLSRVTSHERFEQVNLWVKDWGSLGLLFARMLPVPAFVVNYAAGMVPAIGMWTYLWTAVVSIMPYYLGVALVFQGVFGNWVYAAVGVVPLLIVGLIGLFVRRRGNLQTDWQRRFSKWQ